MAISVRTPITVGETPRYGIVGPDQDNAGTKIVGEKLQKIQRGALFAVRAGQERVLGTDRQLDGLGMNCAFLAKVRSQ